MAYIGRAMFAVFDDSFLHLGIGGFGFECCRVVVGTMGSNVGFLNSVH